MPSHARYARLARVAAISAGLFALAFNVLTLSFLWPGGRVPGFAAIYIWWSDLCALAVAVAGVAPWRRARRVSARLALAAVALGSAEAGAAIGLRIETGGWAFLGASQDEESWARLSAPHPHLVGVGRAKASYQYPDARVITHNSQGFRGRDFSAAKPMGRTRIAAVGGSTTYCVGISDEEAWPAILDRILGPGYETINCGYPGYGSVEHVIQAAFQLPEIEADVAIFYAGWNDVRCSHVPDLQPDYANFVGGMQYSGLSLPPVWRGPKFALERCAILGLQRGGLLRKTPADLFSVSDKVRSDVDPVALRCYERNLGSLAALCRAHGIKPVFVPQILNKTSLELGGRNAWWPHLENKDLARLIDVYNAKMAEVAKREGVPYVEAALNAYWDPYDFVDLGHFSPRGSDKFARIVRSFIVSNRL